MINSPSSPKSDLSALKDEILFVMQSIERIKMESRKLSFACRANCSVYKKASGDKVAAARYRMQETHNILRDTEMRVESRQLYNPVCGEDILRRLNRPEHFPLTNFNYYEKTKLMASASSNVWDESEYKLTLIRSLYDKVLLKAVLVALSHNLQVLKACRGMASICADRRLLCRKKIIFLSIKFAALSSKYIDISSKQQALAHRRHKGYTYMIATMKQHLIMSRRLQHSDMLAVRACEGRALRSSIGVLCWNRRKMIQLRMKARWAVAIEAKLTAVRCFSAWVMAANKSMAMRKLAPMDTDVSGASEGGAEAREMAVPIEVVNKLRAYQLAAGASLQHAWQLGCRELSDVVLPATMLERERVRSHTDESDVRSPVFTSAVGASRIRALFLRQKKSKQRKQQSRNSTSLNRDEISPQFEFMKRDYGSSLLPSSLMQDYRAALSDRRRLQLQQLHRQQQEQHRKASMNGSQLRRSGSASDSEDTETHRDASNARRKATSEISTIWLRGEDPRDPRISDEGEKEGEGEEGEGEGSHREGHHRQRNHSIHRGNHHDRGLDGASMGDQGEGSHCGASQGHHRGRSFTTSRPAGADLSSDSDSSDSIDESGSRLAGERGGAGRGAGGGGINHSYFPSASRGLDSNTDQRQRQGLMDSKARRRVRSYLLTAASRSLFNRAEALVKYLLLQRRLKLPGQKSSDPHIRHHPHPAMSESTSARTASHLGARKVRSSDGRLSSSWRNFSEWNRQRDSLVADSLDVDGTSSEDLDDVHDMAHMLVFVAKQKFLSWLESARLNAQRKSRDSKIASHIRRKSEALARRKCFAAWGKSLEKVQVKLGLCARIHINRQALRLLRRWRTHYKTKFERISSRVRVHNQTASLRGSFRLWQTAFRLNRAELGATRLILRRRSMVLERLFEDWRAEVAWQKRYDRLMDRCRLAILRDCFGTILTKSRNSALLRRVFEVREQVIWFRNNCGPTNFQIISRVIDGWKEYTRRRVQEKREVQHIDQAELFYSASLTTRCFFRWLDHVSNKKSCRQQARLKFKQINSTWLQTILSAWREVSVRQSKFDCEVVGAKMRVRDLTWKKIVLIVWSSYARLWRLKNRLDLHSKKRLKTFFSEWRTTFRCTRCEAIVAARTGGLTSQLWTKRAFFAWRRLFKHKKRLLKGGSILERAMERAVLRHVLRIWPGRKQFELSEALRQRILRKSRGRARLVDVEIGRNCKEIKHPEGDENDPLNEYGSLSRVHDLFGRGPGGHPAHPELRNRKGDKKQSSISFLELTNIRSLRERVIAMSTDNDDFLQLYVLLRAVLHEWKRAVGRGFELRKCARLATWTVGKRLMARALRAWTALTPCTSHRILLWMQKKHPLLSQLDPVEMLRYVEGHRHKTQLLVDCADLSKLMPPPSAYPKSFIKTNVKWADHQDSSRSVRSNRSSNTYSHRGI